MARNFDRASSHFLEHAVALVTAAPFTFAAWIKTSNVTDVQTIMNVERSTTSADGWQLSVRGDVAGDPIRWQSQRSTVSSCDTTTGITAGTWHHAAGVEAAGNSRTVYLDGGNSATNGTSKVPTNIDVTAIGRRSNGTPTNYFDGDIAEAAIWNVALSAADVAALAKGVSPFFVRPGNIIAYWPLIGRFSPENDLTDGSAMTVTGSVVADHPRIYYPAQPQIIHVAAAAATVTPMDWFTQSRQPYPAKREVVAY